MMPDGVALTVTNVRVFLHDPYLLAYILTYIQQDNVFPIQIAERMENVFKELACAILVISAKLVPRSVS